MMMKKGTPPPGKKSERLALFRVIHAQVVKHLPHNYAAFTEHHFKGYKDLTHIYSVKRRAFEDWDIMTYWIEEFVPSDVRINGWAYKAVAA